MRIPNADRAIIDPMKLHGYLLSPSHPIGRLKAALFRGLGYSLEDWRQLETDLRTQHLSANVMLEEQSRTGRSIPSALFSWGHQGDRRTRERLVRSHGRGGPSIRDRLPGGWQMTYHVLDTVVLARDLDSHGLRRGDLGAVVEVHEPDGLEVEFVTASGRTAALLTLNARDVRPVADDDLVSVRTCRRSA